MAINQLIAAGIQQPRFESPLNMMAQLSQLEQARQANALNQMRMQQFERQMAQEEALASALRGGRPLTLEQAILGGEQGLRVLEAQERQALANQKRQAQQFMPVAFAMRGAVNKPVESSDESDTMLMSARQMLADVGIQGPEVDQRFASLALLGTPERRRAGLEAMLSTMPGLTEAIAARDKEAAALAKTDAETRKTLAETGQVGRPTPLTPEQRARYQAQTAEAEAKTAVERARLAGTLPAPPAAPPEIIRLQSALANLPPDSPQRADIQKRIEALGRANGITIETPVPVVDPKTGQVTYATRAEALGKTPPQFMEGLTPRERQNREAKLPAAKTAVAAFDAKSDKLATQIEELIDHPGLNQITGLIAGRIVGITDAGRRAEALYKSIVAQGGFSELQAMRDASTTGGALGNVSNQEGQYLRDAFAVLQRTQSTEDLQRGLRDALKAIRSAQLRTREAFEDTYAYREGAAPTVAPPSRGSAGGEQTPAGGLPSVSDIDAELRRRRGQ